MKIDARYKVREMAGEHVVIMQGRYGADMTRVVALNDTSLFLWNALEGRDFDIAEAARLLIERYGVEEATALRDAAAWTEKLRECDLLTNE
ncbi:PqqD family protein [Alistipes sp.]|uniref:PqqD family protein n=1 Tax=Alistipes sp. TaxID=1872444 RepID=UPI0011CB9A85